MNQSQNDTSLDNYAAALAAQKYAKDAAIKGLVLKLIALVAAIVSVIGILTFFWFDDLVAYRWWMIIGGTVVSAAASFWGDKYQMQLRAMKEIGPEELVKQVVADTAGGRAEEEMDSQDNASR